MQANDKLLKFLQQQKKKSKEVEVFARVAAYKAFMMPATNCNYSHFSKKLRRKIYTDISVRYTDIPGFRTIKESYTINYNR